MLCFSTDPKVCKYFLSKGAIAVPINWNSVSTKFNFAGGVSCSGNETHILECPFNSLSSCPSSNDANVICPRKNCIML